MFVAKVLLVLGALVLVSGHPLGYERFGGAHSLSEEELESAQETLQKSLNKLAAGEGPYYRISKVLSASTQIVAGTLEKYNVELIDSEDETKVCDVEIWRRSWLPNGVEVTFDCPSEEKLTRNHSA